MKPICVLGLVAGCVSWVTAAPLVLHVSPSGDDRHPGTAAQPLRTLEGARAAVRELKRAGGLPADGVEVRIHAGEYAVCAPVVLTREDSGQRGRPVVYRAAEPGEVRLFGGVRLRSFRPVEESWVRERLPEVARSRVVECDLRAAGLTNLPPLELGGFGSGRGFRTHPVMELFFDGRPLPMARWPNEGFVRTGPVPEPHTLSAWDGRPGSPEGRFGFADDRLLRWEGEPELWLYGYWFWDWADSYEKVERIDAERREIRLARPGTGTGSARANAFAWCTR
ncbi:MAG: hypothetical protein KatS3mg132_336 [Limisphaera sp.]|nr:MAG: hypothetical protein KatS3mg132_336 [Limisphaera sp.]